MSREFEHKLTSFSPEETELLGAALEPQLVAGDVLLLKGDIGSGKSVLARAIIQSRMARSGQLEDVPSPTFTLVQTYELADGAILHADLYRITQQAEVLELGLADLSNSSVLIVEWPEIMGDMFADRALKIAISMGTEPGVRLLDFTSNASRWSGIHLPDAA